jgi:hypothetical protein
MNRKEINIHNYEEFLVDYMDGTLSAHEALMVEAFLDAHPQIREEFETTAGAGLEADTVEFPDKEFLKRYVEALSETDEMLIAYMEGDLDGSDKDKVDEMIRTDERIAGSLKLYQLTRLHPSTDVQYPEKNQLRQPVPLYGQSSGVNKWVLRIAAVLALLIGSVLVIQTITQDANQPVNEVAESGAESDADELNTIPETEIPVLADENIVEKPAETFKGSSIKDQSASKQVADNTGLDSHQKKGASDKGGSPEGDKDSPTQELDRSLIDQMPVLADYQLTPDEIQSQPATDPELQVIEQEGEYMGFFQGLRTLTQKEVAREIASNEEGSGSAENDSYKKIKLLDMVGLGLKKASDDKIQLTKQTSGDNVTAYGLSIGKFKIEKK